MMKQMLNLRAMSKQPQGTADQERKKKAEELITKLIGNDNFIWSIILQSFIANLIEWALSSLSKYNFVNEYSIDANEQ